MRHLWARAVLAGLGYFAVVFAFAFVFGAARAVVLTQWPAIGRTAAVLAEVPVILGLSWIVCGAIMPRARLNRRLGAGTVMGLVAFALLIAAETALQAALSGESLSAIAAHYGEPSYAIGLVGQIAFAAVPALQATLHRRRGVAPARPCP